MSVTQERDVMEIFKKTKEKLENWPLMTCTEEEKIQWFKDVIGPMISRITLGGDKVDEIVIIDDLYDIAVEALDHIPLPADFPDQPNVTRDQLERDFAAYCKTIVVRTATIEQLALEEEVAPELQFIRPVTSRMKINGFLDQWDRAIGFTETLRGSGCPFDYSYDEKKLLFGFAHLMNCMAMQTARNQQIDKSKANMFNME